MNRLWQAFALLVLSSIPSTSSAQWTATAGPETGPVSVISVDRVTGRLFAVGNEVGFRSTDAGASWHLLYDRGLPGSFFVETIAANNGIVYASGVFGAGAAIFRSSDGGDTWTNSGISGLSILSVPIAFDVAGATVLAGIEGGGVYKSTNDGATWTASSTGLPAGTGIGYFARHGGDLYAGTSLIAPTKTVYRSTDGGASWAATNFSLAGFPSIIGLGGNSVGVFVATTTAGVHRTTNDGATWEKVNPDAATNFAFTLFANDANLFVAIGSRIFRTDANGANWVAVSNGLPPANAGLAAPAIAVSGSSVVVAEGSLGIYRTTDAGANWAPSNTGLNATRVNQLFASGSYLFAAADAGGFYRTGSHGDAWALLDQGIEPYTGWYAFGRTGTTLLGGSAVGRIYRSTDDGDHWTLSNTGLGLTSTNAFVVDAATPSIVYAAGYPGVAKSTDSGMSWTTLSTGLSIFQIALAIWKDGPAMLVGTNAGIKRLTDHGDTWTAPITGLAPTAGYGDFTQHGDTIYVVGTTGVFRSVDDGATWTATASLIGTQSVHAVGVDLFAGGSNGVFHSTNAGASWTAINEGFPVMTHVRDLASDGEYLYAGALRSSVWRRPIGQVTPALASLVSAQGDADRARVTWYVGGSAGLAIDRRTANEDWSELRSASADGSGYVVLEDETVEPGRRYGYRLRWGTGASAARAGEVWVEIPAIGAFAVHGARPHPVADPGAALAFTIPRAGGVTIELLDLAGRRVGDPHQVELRAGYHVLPMPAWGARAAGVYTARVTFEGTARSARVVIVR